MKRLGVVLLLGLALVGGLIGGALWSLRSGNPLERRVAERLSRLTRGRVSFDGALPRLDLGIDLTSVRWERGPVVLTAERVTVYPSWTALPSGHPLPATVRLSGGRLTLPGAEMTDLGLEGLVDRGDTGPRFRGGARGNLRAGRFDRPIELEAKDVEMAAGLTLTLVARALESAPGPRPPGATGCAPRGRLQGHLRIPPGFEMTSAEARVTLGGAGARLTSGDTTLDLACTNGSLTLQRGSLSLSDLVVTATASTPTTTTPVQTVITAAGTVTDFLADEPLWRLQARSAPLALDEISAFLPPPATGFLRERRLRGHVGLLGVVDGTGLPRATLRVDLAGAGLETRLAGNGHLVEILRGAATLSAGPRLTLTGVDATVAGVPVRLAATLARTRDGGTEGEGRFETERLPVTDLVPLLPPRAAAAVTRLSPSGTVSVQVRVVASAGQPPSLEGRLDLDDLSLTLPLGSGGTVARLPRLHADLGIDELRLAPARLTVGGTTVELGGRLRLGAGALVGEDLVVTVAGLVLHPQLRLELAGMDLKAHLPATPVPVPQLAPFLPPRLAQAAIDGRLRGDVTLAASARGNTAGLATHASLTVHDLRLALETGGPTVQLPHLEVSFVDGVPTMVPTTVVLGEAGQVALELTTDDDGTCVLGAHSASVSVTALTSFVPSAHRQILTRLSPRGSLSLDARLPLTRPAASTVTLNLDDVSVALPVPGPDRRLGLGGCTIWTGSSLDIRDVRVNAGSVCLTVDDGAVARRTNRGWETTARLSGQGIRVSSLLELLPTGSRLAAMPTTGSVDVVADLRGVDHTVELHALVIPRDVSARLDAGLSPATITTGALAVDLTIEGDEVRASARLTPPLRILAGDVEAVIEGGVDDMTRAASVGVTLTATNLTAASLMTLPGASWWLPTPTPEGSLLGSARLSGPAEAPHLKADLVLGDRTVTLEGSVTDPLGVGRLALRVTTPPVILSRGGSADLSADVTGTLRSPLLAGAAAVAATTLAVDVPGAEPFTFPVTDVEGLWRYAPRESRIELSEVRGRLAGGTFTAEGSASLTTAPSRIHLNIRNADARPLLVTARVLPIVGGRADLEFSGSVGLEGAVSLSGSGFVDLREAVLDGDVLSTAVGATDQTTSTPRGPGSLGRATATITAGSGVLRLEPLSSRGGPSALDGSFRLDLATMALEGRLTASFTSDDCPLRVFTVIADGTSRRVVLQPLPEPAAVSSQTSGPPTTASGEASSPTTGP